jgi:sec-independent protein translocase protein TatA
MAISAWEIALIVLVVVLLFGAKRVPQAARSLGRGVREFKESVTDHTKELKEATLETPKELRRALDPFADSEQGSEARPVDEPAQPDRDTR